MNPYVVPDLDKSQGDEEEEEHEGEESRQDEDYVATQNADNNNSDKLPKPKKPQSAYFFYLAEQRPAAKEAILAEGAKSANIGDIGKRLGVMWKELGEEEKKKYAELANADKERYSKEIEEWKINGGSEDVVEVEVSIFTILQPLTYVYYCHKYITAICILMTVVCILNIYNINKDKYK